MRLCGLALVIVVSLLSQSASAQLFEQAIDEPEWPWLRHNDAEPAWQAEDEEERIETDRDSFTPATTTVAAGRSIWETSYSFIDSRHLDDTHSLPELLIRYGVTKRLELRLGTNYEVGGGGSVSGNATGEVEETGRVEESEVLYGFKFLLTDQHGWIPQSAAIVQGTTPTAGPDPATDLQVGYVFGWTIFRDWKLDTSVRYLKVTEEGDHFNQWAPSVVLKVPVHERWNVHGEYFGMFSTGREDNLNPQYFSPGLHYLVSNNFEVGVRVGWGLNKDAENFFSNVGLGLLY